MTNRVLSVNEVQAVIDELKLAFDEENESIFDNISVPNLTNWVNDSLGYEQASHKDNQVFVDQFAFPIIAYNDKKTPRITVVIDPNVRIKNNRTFSGFEDIYGGWPKEGDIVEVHERESGIHGEARVMMLHHKTRLIYLDINWINLTGPELF